MRGSSAPATTTPVLASAFDDHRAELVHVELVERRASCAVLDRDLLEAAGAALAEQDRARRVEVDRGGDHRHQRRGQREADGSLRAIDRAFGDSNAAKHDRVVPRTKRGVYVVGRWLRRSGSPCQARCATAASRCGGGRGCAAGVRIGSARSDRSSRQRRARSVRYSRSCRRSRRSSTTSRSTPISARAAAAIEIAINPGERELVIEVKDHGASVRYRRGRTAPGELDEASLPEGGMGIHIAKTMLDEMTYEPGPPNLWRLRKRIARGPRRVFREELNAVTCLRHPAYSVRTPRSRCAARSTSTPRRSSPRRSIACSRPSRAEVVRRSVRPRSDRQLRRRRAGQAVQGRPLRGRERRDHGRARSAARDLQAAPHGQGIQPVALFARPRDHEDLPERRRAALGAVQSPAVRGAARALRPRGDGHDPVVPRGGSALEVVERGQARERAAARAHRGASTSRTRGRCSFRSWRMPRGDRCMRRSSRRWWRRIAARSMSCSGRGRIPMGLRR